MSVLLSFANWSALLLSSLVSLHWIWILVTCGDRRGAEEETYLQLLLHQVFQNQYLTLT